MTRKQEEGEWEERSSIHSFTLQLHRRDHETYLELSRGYQGLSRFDHILLPSQALEGIRVGSRAARTGTVAPIWMLTFPVENSLQYHDAGPLSELFANGLHTSQETQILHLIILLQLTVKIFTEKHTAKIPLEISSIRL